MAENPLKIVSGIPTKEKWVSDKKNNRQEAIAKFNRLWLINPEQFDPNRNALERLRIERTCELCADVNGLKVVDLGCSGGTLSRKLRDKGANVDAVDISSTALKLVQDRDCTRIETMQDYIPRTKLRDDTYDLVVAADLVAYLPVDEYRLFMSELSRIVKPGGRVFCSTPLDLDSSNSLELFVELSDTEFQPDEWKLSYHRYWLKLNNFLDAPARFARAGENADYRTLKLQERKGVSRTWFKWNSSSPLYFVWKVVSFISAPIHNFYKNNRTILLGLEKICKAASSQWGISHAMWIGKRRPLVEYTPPSEQPIERKGKRQVWE